MNEMQNAASSMASNVASMVQNALSSPTSTTTDASLSPSNQSKNSRSKSKRSSSTSRSIKQSPSAASSSAQTTKKGNHNNNNRLSERAPASDLHRMLESAFCSDDYRQRKRRGGVTWTQILHHLEMHTTLMESKRDKIQLPFDGSPLAPHCVATPALARELSVDPKSGHSVLRKAVMHPGTPLRIIAALCHLAPQALVAPDRKDRLPLHLACRLPVCPESEALLRLLLQAHPAALLARDVGGRTPLHWLLWFHTPQRTASIVNAFCSRPLPRTQFYSLQQYQSSNYKNAKHYPLPEIPRPQQNTKIPNNASIIPDAMHGCLALHYAVAGQASIDVISTLLQAFPLSRHVPDRYGRTAAHWYLGAGHFLSATRHVSGEPPDPHQAPYEYRVKCDPDVLKLLLSSRVARTTDWLGRHILHWACQWMARTHHAHMKHKNKKKVLLLATAAAANNEKQASAKAENDEATAAIAAVASRNSSASYDHHDRTTTTTPTTTTSAATMDDDDDDDTTATATTNTTSAAEHNDDSDVDDLPPPLTTSIIKCVLDPFQGQIFARDYQQKTPIMVFFDTIAALQQEDYEKEQKMERREQRERARDHYAQQQESCANNPQDDDHGRDDRSYCSEDSDGSDGSDDSGTEGDSYYTEDDTSRYTTSSRSATTASRSRKSGGRRNHRNRRRQEQEQQPLSSSSSSSTYTNTSSKLPQYDLINGGPAAVNPDMEFLTLLCEHPDYAGIATSASAAVSSSTDGNDSSHKSSSKPKGLVLPTALEDETGRLPLHAALQVAASPDCIKYLIQQHPTSLVHTTEEGFQAPLHAAFLARHTARLQSVAVIKLLLNPYTAGKHGTLVDGRLALKLEDAQGSYPIHYACQNEAPLAVLQHMIQRYPQAALQQRSVGSSENAGSSPSTSTARGVRFQSSSSSSSPSTAGDLPVHCLVTPQLVEYLTTPSNIHHDNNTPRARSRGGGGRSADDDDDVNSTNALPPLPLTHIPGLEVIRQKMRLLLPLLCLVDGKHDEHFDGSEDECHHYQEVTPTSRAIAKQLGVAGSVCKMMPLHIAILFHAAPYSVLLRMLELYPPAAMQFTVAPQYSALDLHELRREDYLVNKDGCGGTSSDSSNVVSEDWHVIRELLFSFSPTLESHRHRQELLDRCVHIVVDEMNHDPSNDDGENVDADKMQLSSYHWYNRTEVANRRRGVQKPGGNSNSAKAKKCPLDDLNLSHSLSEMELAARQQFKIRAPSSSIHHQLEKIRGGAKRQSVIARLKQKQKQLQALVPLSPLSASTHRVAGFRQGDQNGEDNDADDHNDLDTGGDGGSRSMTDFEGCYSSQSATDSFGHAGLVSSGSGISDNGTAFLRRNNEQKSAGKISRTGVKPAPRGRSKKSIYDDDGILNLIEDFITNVSSDDDENSDDESFTTTDRDDEDGDVCTEDEGEDVDLDQERATLTEGEEDIDDGGSYTTDHGATTSFDDGTTLDASSTFGQSMDLSVRWTVSKKPMSTDDDMTDAFDLALLSTEEEEKKEEVDAEPIFGRHDDLLNGCAGAGGATPKASNMPADIATRRPDCLSEVGMRLWTFFALYLDPNNPSDTYVSQVAAIFNEIQFSTVERLVSMELPPFSLPYLVNGRDPSARTFRDIASPKCRELIHKTCFFVGKYDFCLNAGASSGAVASSGKGSIGNDEDILVERCHSGQSVVVRAHEWSFTTQEVTDAVNPGVSEAQIWKTGEIPSPIGVTFRSHKRDVFVKFTMDEDEYANEIACQRVFDIYDDHCSDVVKDECTTSSYLSHPIIAHYSAFGNVRSADRSYRTDIGDERFQTLQLYPGKKICLGDYPFAMVFPRTVSLADRYARYGIDSLEDIKQICGDIGKTLSEMHSKGVVHGDLSMRNVVLGPASKPIAERTQWTLTNFTTSSFIIKEQQRRPMYLGSVSSKGLPLFSTGTIPPELLVKLTPDELRAYRKYWQTVERVFEIDIERSAIEPVVDLVTGATYVVRCHYRLPSSSPMEVVNLPALPYSLVAASGANDIWAFGQLLFELCARQPLLSVDPRSRRLLDYTLLERWSSETAESLVFEHISDPIAQDLLLMLLSPLELRSTLSMKEVLAHPFFQPAGLQRYTQSRSMIEKRRQDTVTHKRTLQNKLFESSEEAWVNPRTFPINCWDLDFLPKFAMSPTEIVKTMMGRSTDALQQPCSFIVLPYKLSRSRSLLLTPKTRNDIEKAEALGASLLRLSKACHFACVLQKATTSSLSYEQAKWTSSEVFKIMGLSPNEFGDIQMEMADMAAKHVESFRHNPMSVAIKVVQARLQDILDLFEDAEIYVYLVDEYQCLPLVEYPYVVQVEDERRRELLERCILPMHLSCLYARGVFGDVSGLVKLIFEAAYPHAPPSWVAAASGLSHGLDEESMVNELKLLEDTLVDLYSCRHRIGDDDVSYMRDFCSQVDPKRRLGGLCRVLAGDACLWTTADNAREITELTQSFTLKDALREQRQQEAKVPPESLESIRSVKSSRCEAEDDHDDDDDNQPAVSNAWADAEASLTTSSTVDDPNHEEDENILCTAAASVTRDKPSSSPMP